MNPASPGLSRDRPGSLAAETPIRLMIVDDSATARSVLARMLAGFGDLIVVAEAGNAAEALDALQSVAVDIVLLDVEMPGGSGLDALPEILRRGGGAHVLIVSSICEDGAAATVRALALGAADTLPKPGTGHFAGRFAETLADRLRKIGRARIRAVREPARPARGEAISLRAMSGWKLGCIALGASTGGLHALTNFLSALPRAIGIPILVTQHLPPLFIPFFARQLEAVSGRPTWVADEGAALKPDEILVAPGDAHLGLRRHGGLVTVALSRAPTASACRPSVDPMLAGLAQAYGKSGLGIILSGMGKDGLVGAGALAAAGGALIVQDEASAAVWGMPRAVAEAGLASAVLPPAELARRVAARAGIGAW